ncbi:MAG: penicillin acylase family protein [Caulobacteraceae bacterium]
MSRHISVAICALVFLAGGARADNDLARERAEAAQVTVTRDDWGIAHVRGPTDALAVFGAVYAQAEDDFPRIEANYLGALGRTAEAQGKGAIWADLRQRLFNDPDVLKAQYAASPAWLRALMDAWADGLDFYLATHPETHPKGLRRFEPWMALSFSEGSIGGDIERVSLPELARFYGATRVAEATDPEPSGSNGIAIAPADSKDGHALLLINPHTSFYFRSELQMESDQGLDAYGAATWGQMFLYQGFNEHAGWILTSSGVDAVDEFAETIVRRGGRLFYRYGAELRPVTSKAVAIDYRAADGSMKRRIFTVFRTHHGPIVRQAGGKWIAIAMMNKPVAALEESFLRTKARDYAELLETDKLQANSSNNTIFADDRGETAYLHPSFIPRRDDHFDYTRPVDGANPATDWKGLHAPGEAPHLLNPAVGWLFNTNDWPYSAAGPDSPKRADYPRYMDVNGENPRGLHALRLLSRHRGFTLESLRAAAFDPYLPAFAELIPGLVRAWDTADPADPFKRAVKDQIGVLRAWDDRWSADSVATSLAVFWATPLWAREAAGQHRPQEEIIQRIGADVSDSDKLAALAAASDRLARDFGTWRTPWGRINRFQRLDDSLEPHFSDAQPSIPVPFTSSRWGSLASFGAHPWPGTKRWYGTSGNSFVAVVEFGPRVRAVAVTAGGESGDPASSHFDDEAARYASGDLREVYFWPDQLVGHTERAYHPGE